MEDGQGLERLKKKYRPRFYRNTNDNVPSFPSGLNMLSVIKNYIRDPGGEKSVCHTSFSFDGDSPVPNSVQIMSSSASLQTSKLSVLPSSRVKTDPKMRVTSEPRLEQEEIPHFTSCNVNVIAEEEEEEEEEVVNFENEQLHLQSRNVETPNNPVTKSTSRVRIYSTDGSVVQEPPSIPQIPLLQKRLSYGDALVKKKIDFSRALEKDFERNSADQVDRKTDPSSDEMDINSQEETKNFLVCNQGTNKTSNWDTFITEKSPSPIRSEVAGSISRATRNSLELQSVSYEISEQSPFHSYMGQQSIQKKEKFQNSKNDETDLNITYIQGSESSQTPSATRNSLELQSVSYEISEQSPFHSYMGQQSIQKKEKFQNSKNDETDLNITYIQGSESSKTPSGSGQQESSKPLKTPEQSSEQSQRPQLEHHVSLTPEEMEEEEFIFTKCADSPDWSKNKRCPRRSTEDLPRNQMSEQKKEDSCMQSKTKRKGKNIQSQSDSPDSHKLADNATDVPAQLKRSDQQKSSKPLKTPEQSSEQSQRLSFRNDNTVKDKITDKRNFASLLDSISKKPDLLPRPQLEPHVSPTPEVMELGEFIITKCADSPDWSKNKRYRRRSTGDLSKSKENAKFKSEGESSSKHPSRKPRNQMSEQKKEDSCMQSKTKRKGKNIQSQSDSPDSHKLADNATDVPAQLKHVKRKMRMSEVDKLALPTNCSPNVIHLDEGLSSRPKRKSIPPSKWFPVNTEVSTARHSQSKKVKKLSLPEVDKLALPTYFATNVSNLDEGSSSRPKRKCRAVNTDSPTVRPFLPKSEKNPETNSEESAHIQPPKKCKQNKGKKTPLKKNKKVLEQNENSPTSSGNVKSEKMGLSTLKRLSEENKRSPKHTLSSSESHESCRVDDSSKHSSEELPENGNANCEDEQGPKKSQRDESTAPFRRKHPWILPLNTRISNSGPALTKIRQRRCTNLMQDVVENYTSHDDIAVVYDVQTNSNRLGECIKRFKDVRLPNQSIAWISFSNYRFSAGKIFLLPSYECREYVVNDHTLIFHIICGNVTLQLHKSFHTLEAGDFFLVPPWNPFCVKNIGPGDVELVFTRMKPFSE
ncbi:uncharacterized protein [Hyperolius riggenbachi]|uniref:uncharacterized protein isoform X2 n=1 Tax=Hyperolius riggenbachi TaxID=752182 RepID=UPI0035A37FD4